MRLEHWSNMFVHSEQIGSSCSSSNSRFVSVTQMQVLGDVTYLLC
jgi:hypothetical protein